MRLVALALLLASCATPRPGGIGTSPSARPAANPAPVSSTAVYVSCMAEPPPVAVIDWPTPDSIGNVLMHASTVERVQGAYADLRRYVDEQYFRCLHVAEAAGQSATSVTVEVDP